MTKKRQASPAAGDATIKLLCGAIAEAMLDKKAQNVMSLDLSSIDGAIANSFVLCNADSTTQVEAIADNVEEQVRETLGEKPVRREGFENAIWIILDYVSVMAHIFQTEARNFYRLEALWADAGQQRYSDEPQAAITENIPSEAAANRKTEAKKSAPAAKKPGRPVKKVAAPKEAAGASKASGAKKVAAAKKTAGVKATGPAAKKPASAAKKAVTAPSPIINT
jgi:ribosome-associated protein